MPKSRYKTNTFGYDKIISTDGLRSLCIKSGVMTYNHNKLKRDEDLSFSFFKNNWFHKKNDYDTKFFPYNDNRTINFIEKNVLSILGIEDKYLTVDNFFSNQNNILSTPNLLIGPGQQLDYINSNTTSETYNKILKENYLESDKSSYKENVELFNTNENYETISIDFDFKKNQNSDLYLSFSKNSNSRQVSFPDGTSYFTFNGNTAYFYNPEKIDSNNGPFDYIGNISKDYKSDVSTFIDSSPICFSSLSPYSILQEKDQIINNNPGDSSEEVSNLKKYSYGTIPINSFGFPFKDKFSAKSRHMIKASSYITKPFVLEKVCIEFTMSNWSVSRDDGQKKLSCLNFVNFFLLNQKGNLNSNSLNDEYTVNYEQSNSVTIDNIFNDIENKYTINNRSSNSTFSENEINDMQIDGQVVGESIHDSIHIVENEIDNVDNYSISNIQQRDLITSISIANFSSGRNSLNDYLINKEKISSIVDEFNDNSLVDPIDETTSSECIFINKKFKIESDVKHFSVNKKIPSFSKFRIYPEKIASDRTNLDIRSSRSIPSENLNINDNNIETNSDYFGKNILFQDKDFIKSNYILHPSDNLILGVSLNPSFETQEDYTNLSGYQFGEDLVKISCSDEYPFKLHLVGYYLEDSNKKNILNKETKNYKRSKRIGYSNLENVDNIGSSYAYLSQNYYDRYNVGSSGLDIYLQRFSQNNKSRIGNKFELPNFSDGEPFTNTMELFYSLSTPTLVFNYKKDFYSLKEESETIFVHKHFYDKYQFGMPSNKLYYNKIYQFEDSKYKNIKKRFMSGFFKQKTPAKVSGKLKIDFSKLNEFKGLNYLKEYIMTSSSGKSESESSLVFDLKDNNNNHVKLFFLTGLNTGNNEPSDLFTNINNEEVVLTYVNDRTDGIVNNFELNSTNNQYSGNLQVGKRSFVDLIVSSINEINNKIQVDKLDPNITKDFRININAEVLEETLSSDIVEIKLTLINRGSINGASIIGNEINSGIIIENFSVEEGDLFNSYNINENSYYSDNDLLFYD